MTCLWRLKLLNLLKIILRSSTSRSSGKLKTPLEDYALLSSKKNHYVSSFLLTLRLLITRTSPHRSDTFQYQLTMLDAQISSIGPLLSANALLGVFQYQNSIVQFTVLIWELQLSLQLIKRQESTFYQLFAQIRNPFTNALSNQALYKKNAL